MAEQDNLNADGALNTDEQEPIIPQGLVYT